MNKQTIIDLYTQFNKVHNQFTAVKRHPMTSPTGEAVYAAEMQVLMVLNKHPEYSVSDVGTALSMTNSGASQLVKKLTGKGYITKKRNPSNERETMIEITESGYGLINRFMENESYNLGSLANRLSYMSEDDLGIIGQFLSEIEGFLEEKQVK